MRVTNILLVALSAAAVRSQSFRREDRPEKPAPNDATPRRYIIELSSRAQSAQVAAKAADTPGLRVVKHFDSDIFPAVSVDCTEACDTESLKAAFQGPTDEGSSVVVHVYKSQTVELVPPVEELDPVSVATNAAGPNTTIHQATGVQNLHDAGILGEGATIAVVDSGIQYTHPALGGGIGAEFTVIGGHDFVGSNWPEEPAKPDEDPMDEFGHGTHVAGIIAGNSDRIIGVAPKAKLLAYKVLGNNGYSNEEMVIEAFLKAYESGADIISSSLGEGSGFLNNAWAVVASRIVDRGVVVVIAAGNSGQDGPFLASNGASGRHSLTVGSVDPAPFPALGFSVNYNSNGGPNSTEAKYVPGSSAFPDDILDWPVVPITLNTSVENDACEPLPDDTPKLDEAIALVRFGGCTVNEKYANVADFGGKYVLFYSATNQSTAISGTQGSTGAIDATVGKTIIDALIDGGNVTASFDVKTAHYTNPYNAAGGKPAVYSSWGGTYDLAMKPDIAAPGSKILSSYPTDDYRVLSGTSMATPYVAGIAALWVGENGGREAHKDDPEWSKRLIARIMSSARTVPWSDWVASEKDYGYWAPSAQIGAGLVDAVSVLSYCTELGFDGRKFELNDTAHFSGTHSLDITNNGEEDVTYRFSLQTAGGYGSYEPSVPGEHTFGIPQVIVYAYIEPTEMVPEISLPDEITIGAGDTRTVEFIFTEPSGLNASTIPSYSGKVLVTGSNGENLGIPYFGVASSIRESVQVVFDYGFEYPKILKGEPAVPLGDNPTFTFNLSAYSQDYPKLFSQLLWGTEELRWDIFDVDWTEADWSYPTVIGKNGYVGSATSWNGTRFSSYFDPEHHSEDDIFSFPLYYKGRYISDTYYWLGRFANGSTVQPGTYNFRLAALRPFGDRAVSEDWDIFEIPTFTVKPNE